MKAAGYVLLGLLLAASFLFILFRLHPEIIPTEQWLSFPIPEGHTIYALEVFPDGRIFAGLHPEKCGIGGLFYMDYEEQTWNRVEGGAPKGYTSTAIAVCPSDADCVMASFFKDPETADGGVFYSADGGRTWEQRNNGLPEPDVRDLCITNGEPVTYYAGTVANGVYRSTDSGMSWSAVNDGLENLRIQSIEAVQGNPETLYCTTLKGMYKTTDGGGSWKRIESGIPLENPFVLTIKVDPSTAERLYCLVRGFQRRTELFRSTDAGESWHLVGDGLPAESHPRCIAIMAEKGLMFMGTVYDGVYYSIDSGVTWRPLNKGIPITASYIIIHDMAFMKHQGKSYLLAGSDMNASLFVRSLDFGFAHRLKYFFLYSF